MQGLHESTKVVKVYDIAARTATLTDYNGTTIGGASGIDVAGFDDAMVIVQTGAMTGTMDVDILDSASDDASAATQITDSASVEADFDQLGSSDDNTVKLVRIRTKDTKRYIFIKVTNADAGSKTYGITMLLGSPDKVPVTQDYTPDYSHGTP